MSIYTYVKSKCCTCGANLKPFLGLDLPFSAGYKYCRGLVCYMAPPYITKREGEIKIFSVGKGSIQRARRVC